VADVADVEETPKPMTAREPSVFAVVEAHGQKAAEFYHVANESTSPSGCFDDLPGGFELRLSCFSGREKRWTASRGLDALQKSFRKSKR
jgi:hypothetical protein